MSEQEDRRSDSRQESDRGGRRPFRRGGGGGRRRRVCPFCADKIERVEYKDSDLLRRFINEEGKIRPRRQTNVCAKHQRSLARAIKRARHIALLPFTGQHVQDF